MASLRAAQVRLSFVDANFFRGLGGVRGAGHFYLICSSVIYHCARMCHCAYAKTVACGLGQPSARLPRSCLSPQDPRYLTQNTTRPSATRYGACTRSDRSSSQFFLQPQSNISQIRFSTRRQTIIAVAGGGYDCVYLYRVAEINTPYTSMRADVVRHDGKRTSQNINSLLANST